MSVVGTNFIGKTPDFQKSWEKFQRSGNEAAIKATKLLMGAMLNGDKPDSNLFEIKKNPNPETRIQNCHKYRPVDDIRLVTVFQNNTWILLFIGDHYAANALCEAHKGQIIISNQNGEWGFSNQRNNTVNSGQKRHIKDIKEKDIKEIVIKQNLNENSLKPLINKLPTKYKDKLRKLCNGYPELLDHINKCTDNEDFSYIDKIGNEILANRIFDILDSLSRTEDNAIEVTKLRIDDVFTPIDINSQLQLKQDSPEIQIIYNLDEWLKTVEQAAINEDWKDWMTRMHPKQEEIVKADYAEPVYLKGVSGSGKTSVIVSRAERLAKKYPHEKILIVTLNRSLATLIDKLIKTKCPELKNIEVKAFFTVCQDLLRNLGEDMRGYDDKSDVHNEHVDEIWDEYYRCENHNNDAAVFYDTHDSLISGKDAVYPYTYIREELDWVRSAFRKGHREEEYTSVDRQGRKRVNRQDILQGLKGWEEKIQRVGVTDYLNFSSILTSNEYFNSIENNYRCILVDEAQDFGTTELQIIRKLVRNNENDLFICGDPAQKISHKHQLISAAGIPKTKELKSISQNWRNTIEIVEFSNRVLRNNSPNHNQEAKDIKDKFVTPESRNRSGPMPALIKSTGGFSNEISCALAYLRNKSEPTKNSKSKHCIAICGFNEHEVLSFSKQVKLPTLDGTKTLDDGTIFLSDLENTKGFEFDTVIILNCTDLEFPRRYAAPEETEKDISRLYVAMTRAKYELIISHSTQVSDFLRHEKTEPVRSKRAITIMKDHDIRDLASFRSILERGAKIKDLNDKTENEIHEFLTGSRSHDELTWNDFFKSISLKFPTETYESPKHIEDLLGKNSKISEMTWAQFLNTTYAIGLSKELITKLRKISKNASLNNQKVKLLYNEEYSHKVKDELSVLLLKELDRRFDHIKSLGLF